MNKLLYLRHLRALIRLIIIILFFIMVVDSQQRGFWFCLLMGGFVLEIAIYHFLKIIHTIYQDICEVVRIDGGSRRKLFKHDYLQRYSVSDLNEALGLLIKEEWLTKYRGKSNDESDVTYTLRDEYKKHFLPRRGFRGLVRRFLGLE
jgi:hypothetical protein